MSGPDAAAWAPLDSVTAAHGPALLGWAADGTRSRVCQVRGAAGSGKSTLLAWFLAGSVRNPETVTVHAAVLAEGLFADAFAWDLGRQLGYGPTSPSRLLDQLTADGRPLLVLVADLHRSGRGPADRPPSRPATLVQDVLGPLLRHPQVRAVVEVGETSLIEEWVEPADLETLDVGDEPLATAPDAEPPPLGLPRTDDGRVRWDEAPDAVREHALDHALHSDDPAAAVARLLADPGFLVHGSAVAIAVCLADERLPAPPGLRETWRLAAPRLSDRDVDPTERAALLHTAALGPSPALARFVAPLIEEHPYRAAWCRPGTPRTAVAVLPSNPGTLVTADPLGDLTTLDASAGRSLTAVRAPDAGSVRAQSIAALADDCLLLLADTGTLLPAAEDRYGTLDRITVHHGKAALDEPSALPTALGQSPCGTVLVIGDGRGGVHVWSPRQPEPGPLSRALHRAPVTAVTALVLPGDGHVLVMSAAMDGSVRLWETSADPMPAPVEQRPALPTALAVTRTDLGPLLAVAWNDALLHVWQVATGRMYSLPLLFPCSSLAFTAGPTLTVAGTHGTCALTLDTARMWTTEDD